MSKFFAEIRRDKKKLAIALTLVFLVGWLSFAYYLYSNQILVVPIQGQIVDFQSTTLALHLGQIDDSVKAVILYFNSGGGTADACMEIATYVKELAAVKPVIAVMGQLCASGAYYIASFANQIFTHRNTITGSIGVIAVWVDMSQYYEKQGINLTIWTTGPEKDFGADWRPPTKEESDKINATVNSIFQTLITDIQQNRNLDPATLDLVKTGAIFSGSDASVMGLADKVGDIVNAIQEAMRVTGMWKGIVVSSEMDERQKFLRALF